MSTAFKSALGLCRSLLVLDDPDLDHDGEPYTRLLNLECDVDRHTLRHNGFDHLFDQEVFA